MTTAVVVTPRPVLPWWFFLVTGIAWLIFGWIILSFDYRTVWAVAIWTGVAQAAVIGLTALLAIPMPARRPNTGLSRDEGSLRKEHQHA